MLDFPRWKIFLTGLFLVCGVLFAVPSLVPENVRNQIPSALPVETINLGLDLAGGSHILLEAGRDAMIEQAVENMEESVRGALTGAEPRIRIGDISVTGQTMSFMVANANQVDAAREALLPLTTGAGLTGQRDWTIEVRDQTRFVVTLTDAGLDQAIENTMNSATDVIRRRIDELGTREPTIIRQGDNRIVVQVPGLQDTNELKELLGQTAQLEFKMVDVEATNELNTNPDATLAGVGTEVFPIAASEGGGRLAVRRLGGVSGGSLIGAEQSFNENNEVVVSIRFDSEGGARFAQLSRENIGRQFAIILDDEVISYPSFREVIPNGQAQISGQYTVQTANQLAIALRSGALPTELDVVEERTVGGDLGEESIRMGLIAGIIATTSVLAFMVFTYGRFGFYANIALVLNLFLILAVMALLNATLTLPGIAGFVLTVGSAVDANVLINERIREERRNGRRIIAAIEVGYREASRAIFDANITNVIAAALLLWLGSGLIRGFAIVLLIGIATGVWTAVFVTRMFVAIWLRNARPKELVI